MGVPPNHPCSTINQPFGGPPHLWKAPFQAMSLWSIACLWGFGKMYTLTCIDYRMNRNRILFYHHLSNHKKKRGCHIWASWWNRYPVLFSREEPSTHSSELPVFESLEPPIGLVSKEYFNPTSSYQLIFRDKIAMFKPAWFLHILPYLTTSNRFQSHFSGILQAISSFSETSSIFKNTCHVALRSGNFEKHVWTWPFNAIYIYI